MDKVAIEAVEMDLDDRDNLIVGLQFNSTCAHSAYELKACVQSAREGGISQFSFYIMESLPDPIGDGSKSV